MDNLFCIKVVSKSRGLLMKTKGSKLIAEELVNCIQILRVTWFDDSVEIHIT